MITRLDSILQLMLLVTCIGCSKNTPTGPETQQPVVLDGRGGGVIAYCYQPSTGNELHTLYAINADGTANTKLITASIGLNHHNWSPDGAKIATAGYTNQNTTSIYVFEANGTNLVRLTSTEGVLDYSPAWSPNGATIAFTRLYPVDAGYRGELWMMSADGSNQHSIGIDGYYAEWSPDGTRLIYTSEKSGASEIYTCAADGTNEQRITQTALWKCFPVWSHDGKKIVYAAATGSNANMSSYEVYVMNADGSGQIQLTSNSCYDCYPRWSPDDSMISFCSDRSATNHWEVYRMNADGTNVRRVTNTPGAYTAINPVWKPAKK